LVTVNRSCHGSKHQDFETASILDPFMIHELLPSLTETAFGSHLYRVVCNLPPTAALSRR
jgi:hypothetical protein